MSEHKKKTLLYPYSPPTYITPVKAAGEKIRSDDFLKNAIVNRNRLMVLQNNV